MHYIVTMRVILGDVEHMVELRGEEANTCTEEGDRGIQLQREVSGKDPTLLVLCFRTFTPLGSFQSSAFTDPLASSRM